MPTLAEAVGAAAARLERAGVAEARRDAQVLLCHALGCGREVVACHGDRALAPDEGARFETLVARRARREPVAYLTGRREFWSLDFVVTPATLAPRPDSETVIEAVLARLADHARAWRVLDLGTGTGCLLLALLSELPAATGVGVDRSVAAARVARLNAARLGLGARAAFLAGDWTAALAGRFDVVVANPPYVRTGELAGLEPEVAAFEPRGALDGGTDGLDAYRALLPGLARNLRPEGLVVLEVGHDQARDVAALAAVLAPELDLAAIVADLAGRDRCVALRLGGAANL
ncbi:MAG: peptide chain release factor N(5)-glutamine methyltransferase [Alphaproteobacteria bacterium]